MTRFLAVVAVAVAVAASSGVGSARAAHTNGTSCAFDVGAPFLYVDIVFAPATISCSSSQNRITITTVLTNDGAEVARDTRHCTHMAVCDNDVGSFLQDPAGDQTWCTTAWGSVHGVSFAPVTRCESEAF